MSWLWYRSRCPHTNSEIVIRTLRHDITVRSSPSFRLRCPTEIFIAQESRNWAHRDARFSDNNEISDTEFALTFGLITDGQDSIFARIPGLFVLRESCF